IEADAGATVSGRITYRGKPVEGADVHTTTSRATSDPDGKYTLSRVEAGEVQIYAQSNRLGAFTPGPSIVIADGEHKTVDITLDLSASIAGIVVDQNDQPVAGVTLSFSLLHGRDFATATTADDGSFIARAMSGGGDYIYAVRRADRADS